MQETIGLLRTAVRAHGPEAARSAALSRAKLVGLILEHAGPEEAAEEAVVLLHAAPTIRSARLVSDLRALHERSRGRRDAVALHEGVGQTLQTL